MKTRTETVLAVMHILAWIAFIGLLINTGTLVWTYVSGMLNAESIGNRYDDTGLFQVRQWDGWHYTAVMSLLVAIEGIKAYTALLVIHVLARIKLINPFTPAVAEKLEQISYYILATWVVTLLYNAQLKWLMKRVPEVEGLQASSEFILLAGVVFIFAQIFKQGVALQTESQFTV